MNNQYPEIIEELKDDIIWFRTKLDAGEKPSVLVSELHKRGLGTVKMMAIAREATGAGIGDLKTFGLWWNEEGVTDPIAFDEWAVKAFSLQ